MKILCILLTGTLVVFCNLLRTSSLKNERTGEHAISVKENDKIVYLFFKVEKNASDTERIILEDKKTVSGKLKSNPFFDEREMKTGDFIVSLTDAAGKEMVKQSIADPLNPVMEVYEETISRNRVSLEHAEFSIRYAHSENIQIVKIEKVSPSGKKLLFTQKL